MEKPQITTNQLIRTRFAPSPTGLMHVGNARTALLNYLLALAHGGQFIIRIEDTDQVRSMDSYVKHLLQSLISLGINWQEGPDVGGSLGPYYQSKRTSIYQDFYQQLSDKNLLYPCFCTEQVLKASRLAQLKQGQAPRYLGTCSLLSAAEIAARKQTNPDPAWRFRVDPSGQTVFHDLIHGQQVFLHRDIGDFIIRRSDGSPSFFFCSVVDDVLMQITHVIRGDDHLSNTPRQLMIAHALGLVAPEYGHIGLLVGADGAKLSKRHQASSVADYLQEGYWPQALVHYLFHIGVHVDQQQILPMPELAKLLIWEKCSTGPSKWDSQHLHHWQKMVTPQQDTHMIHRWLGNRIQVVPQNQQAVFLEWVRPNLVLPDDVEPFLAIWLPPDQWSSTQQQALAAISIDIWQDFGQILLDRPESTFDEIVSSLREHQWQGRALFLPLRLFLTGCCDGGSLATVWSWFDGAEKLARYRLLTSWMQTHDD